MLAAPGLFTTQSGPLGRPAARMNFDPCKSIKPQQPSVSRRSGLVNRHSLRSDTLTGDFDVDDFVYYSFLVTHLTSVAINGPESMRLEGPTVESVLQDIKERNGRNCLEGEKNWRRHCPLCRPEEMKLSRLHDSGMAKRADGGGEVYRGDNISETEKPQ